MDQRQVHHVMIIGAEAGLVAELEGVLRRHDGPLRFAVASSPCAPALGVCASEVLIVDVDGQAGRNLELLARCRRHFPLVPAIALVRHGNTSAAVAAMKAGAMDCVEKPVQPERLSSAVMAAVSSGQSAGLRACQALSRTETQVLQLLLAGKTNQAIAEQLHRSKRTVEAHRRNIMRKLGASHVADLVRQAFRIAPLRAESADEQ